MSHCKITHFKVQRKSLFTRKNSELNLSVRMKWQLAVGTGICTVSVGNLYCIIHMYTCTWDCIYNVYNIWVKSEDLSQITYMYVP